MKRKINILVLAIITFCINVYNCNASPFNNKTAVAIGKNYSDGTSSVEHAQEAYTSYYNMGISSKLITNPNTSNLNSSHSNGTKYLESGIVYFAGHASYAQIVYTDVIVNYLSGGGGLYIGIIDFDNTKSALVTFAGCNTASNGNDNITYKTYVSGAKATIGWTTDLNISSYKNWNKRFHDKIETKTESIVRW